MSNKLKNESGIVLILCLALLFMLSLIGIASIKTSNTEMQIADNEYKRTRAFYAAESGLEKAAAAISDSYERTGEPPDPLPSGVVPEDNITYGYYVNDEGPAVATQLRTGAYKGLYGMIKTFTINSVGVDNNSAVGVELEMQMTDALIPIFQFAVFYENDLEIFPGPDMTLSGRVHTNKDMYLSAGSDLYIDSYLTAGGNIHHGVGSTTNNNDIWIKDDNDVYQTMRNSDGTFLDSNDDDWVIESFNRWGGRVEDGNHGITELEMETVTNENPTNLIDRDNNGSNPASYENKAGLKFIDEQAYYLQPDNTWINVTATFITNGIVAPIVFYDAREGQNVLSLDLDINLLNASGYFPGNGIIYSSIPYNSSNVSAIRLKNGQQLNGPLTVATDNPMYTLGDFNTVTKQPAALMSDALTILSNGWDDASSTLDLGSRTATTTQVNASIMTGNTLSHADGYSYSGGLENLPRFLENWSGVTFTWKGSAVDLWYSRQSNSPWGGSYYSPPNRDWAFDPDLRDPNNLPPGTPVVNIVQKINWSQKINQAADSSLTSY